MKISTVLAAALAAGLTTFSANAQERGFQQVSTSPDQARIGTPSRASIGRRIIESRGKDDLMDALEAKMLALARAA